MSATLTELMMIQKEAKDNIVNAFEVNNNIVSGTIVFQHDVEYFTQLHYKIKVMINSETFIIKGKVKDTDFVKNKDEVLKLFFKEVAEQITMTIFKDPTNSEALKELYK